MEKNNKSNSTQNDVKTHSKNNHTHTHSYLRDIFLLFFPH